MSYSQEIYDAVRSKIQGGNIAEAVTDAARNAFDISHIIREVAQEFSAAGSDMQRPSVLFKPVITQDGNAWIVVLGPNLAVGVVGVGNTPAEAMLDFDRVFYGQRKPTEA